MLTYILQKDWRNAEAGTKFFFQDGMYFYKTQTEQEFYADPSEIESLIKSKTMKEFDEFKQIPGIYPEKDFGELKSKSEKWDEPQINIYQIQMPGVKNMQEITADSIIFDQKLGFIFLYIEGAFIARIPKEALIIKLGKVHK